MKIIFFLLTLVFLTSASVFAESDKNAQINKNCSSTKPFFISVGGTRNYLDIKFLKETLNKFSNICRITPSSEANKLVTLAGDYSGSDDSLIIDIKGIIVDRFRVKNIEKEPFLKVDLFKLQT